MKLSFFLVFTNLRLPGIILAVVYIMSKVWWAANVRGSLYAYPSSSSEENVLDLLCPSCRQTVSAEYLLKFSKQTVPHVSLK